MSARYETHFEIRHTLPSPGHKALAQHGGKVGHSETREGDDVEHWAHLHLEHEDDGDAQALESAEAHAAKLRRVKKIHLVTVGMTVRLSRDVA